MCCSSPCFQFTVFSKGRELAKEINAHVYLECSAYKNDSSVEDVFKEVAKQVYKQRLLMESMRYSFIM